MDVFFVKKKLWKNNENASKSFRYLFKKQFHQQKMRA